MEHALFALPIQAGKTDAARVFLQQLEGERKGHTRHRSNGWESPKKSGRSSSHQWVICSSSSFRARIWAAHSSQFVASQDEFDQWFKRQVNEIAGVDLNVPPPGPLSEILSVYEA